MMWITSCRPVVLMKYTNLFATMATSFATSSQTECLAPETKQLYRLLKREQVSPDSCVLKFALPPGRTYLGWAADIPTCISVCYSGTDEKGEPKVLAKSYSPISHPATAETFDLLVKAYDLRPGGGVGAYLCGLQEGEDIKAKVKSQRMMHGSPEVARRWKHVGLVAGGTGIAPLFQLVRILLDDPEDATKIHLLSINRHESDILMKDELDQLTKDYPHRLSVTYMLTGGASQPENGYECGTFDVEVIRKALPPPSSEGDTMIFVCGRDGFVDTCAGPVCRAPPQPDGSKGPKIQGPLLGILKGAGYDASQVFKY
jgi:cytochrome-b5 reductase